MSLLGGIGLGIVNSTNREMERQFQASTPRGQADRARAKLAKEQADQKLAQMQATRPTEGDLALQGGIQSQELKKLHQANRQLLQQGAQRDTMQALDRWGSDHDPRHLNTLLRTLEKMDLPSNMFNAIATVQKVTKEDVNGLEQAGYDSKAIFGSKEALSDMVKFINKDGTTGYIDMDQVRATTGYSRYATQRDNEFAAAKARSLAKGRKVTADEASIQRKLKVQGLEPGTPEYDQAFVKLEDERRATKQKGTERKASVEEANIQRRLRVNGIHPGDPDYDREYVAMQDKLKTDQNPYDNDGDSREAAARVTNLGVDRDTEPEVFDRMFNLELEEVKRTKRKTSAEKNTDFANTASDSINEIVGQDFLKMDVSPEWRATPEGLAVEQKIQAIEKGAGVGFNDAQKRRISDLRSLVTIADPASKLTDEQTGIFDAIFHEARTYINDNTDGVQQKAAYAMYENLTRNALFGATVPTGEMRSFVAQFGSKYQKRGPILAALKQNLLKVKSDINSVKAAGNTQVTHFRLGLAPGQLDNVLTNIDTAIEAMGQKVKSKGPRKPGLTAENKAKLDAIKAKFEARN